jgi:ribosomal 30S subunit maturation factor RimM
MTAIENVQKYVGCLILIDKKAENLPKDFYYHSDLVGCAVIDESNQVIGRVSKVEDYPPTCTLRISRDEAAMSHPFYNVFIKVLILTRKKSSFTLSKACYEDNNTHPLSPDVRWLFKQLDHQAGNR